MEIDHAFPDIKHSLNKCEPLLGSVTMYNTTEGSEQKGQQIRSSARVFKKMKLEVSTPPVAAPEKKEKKEEHKQDVKKAYRPLWNADDKTMFFEALNEYGKDFESIQSYVSNKLKKKGVPEHLIKTKDQVRHLYYRTWNKISKYVKFSDEIKKVAQELYGLINYGELRKRVGFTTSAVLHKNCRLNELIYKGLTVVRVKGKNVRIKTPMCRALRKLNQLDDNYEEIKLPNRVAVELRPKDMTSFLRVQSVAQNPRIRTVLPLQKRLVTLISCLNKRWTPVDLKTYDKALISLNVITNNCIPPVEESERIKALLSPDLRLSPPCGSKIDLPSINLSEYFTRQSICLTAYENRLGIKNFDYSSSKSKKNCRQRTGSVSSSLSPTKIVSQTELHIEYKEEENETDSEVNKVNDEAVNTILALKSETVELDETKCDIKVEVKLESNESVVNGVDAARQAHIEKIQRGWTEKDSECMTIGELYLMFGRDSKLVLEYSWDENTAIKVEEIKSEDQEVRLIQQENKNLDMGFALKKLLSLAKLHYRKNVIKCPCGHVCGAKNKVHLKQEMESKILKILTDIDKCSTTEETEEKSPIEETIPEPPTATFVRPTTVYTQAKPTILSQSLPITLMTEQLNSIRNMRPKNCNRKGRPRSQQVVVERKLPLLPNNVGSGHQIVRMNIISQELPVSAASSTETITNDAQNTVYGLPNPPDTNPISVDMGSIQSTSAMLSAPDLNTDDAVISSVPSSPSALLQEGSDDQWLNSEVVDYSLSSLLGNLESPIKTPTLPNEDSRLSQDVDAQLQSLLTMNSVDFAANFADLAAQVVNDIKK